jgi:AAA15 family ATPase/GTPase
MFKSIKIQNFRGIKDLEIKDFGKLNLLVGKNNTCKTSVMEALAISVYPNNPVSFEHFNEIRGIKSFTMKQGSYKIRKELPFHKFQEFLKLFFYDQIISSKNQIVLDSSLLTSKLESQKIKITVEPILDKEHNQLKHKQINNSLSITGLLMNSTINTECSQSKLKIGRENNYSSPDFEGPLTLISENDQKIDHLLANIPELNGMYISSNELNNLSEFKKFFNSLKLSKRVPEVVKLLQKLEPRIKLIDSIDDHFYVDLGLDEMTRLESLGEGTIKLFGLCCFILDDSSVLNNGGVLFIDEIENGLHYTAQDTLWKWLFEIAEEKNIQIFATTHSLDTVRSFTEAAQITDEKDVRLFHFARHAENISVVQGDGKDLENWLNNYEETGHLGEIR